MDAADLDVLASNVNGLRRARACAGGSEYIRPREEHATMAAWFVVID
jgi:hypothetical protein